MSRSQYKNNLAQRFLCGEFCTFLADNFPRDLGNEEINKNSLMKIFHFPAKTWRRQK